MRPLKMNILSQANISSRVKSSIGLLLFKREHHNTSEEQTNKQLVELFPVSVRLVRKFAEWIYRNSPTKEKESAMVSRFIRYKENNKEEWPTVLKGLKYASLAFGAYAVDTWAKRRSENLITLDDIEKQAEIYRKENVHLLGSLSAVKGQGGFFYIPTLLLSN